MVRLSRISLLLTLLCGSTWVGARPDLSANRPDLPSMSVSFGAFWTAARGKPFSEQEALWNRYSEGPRENRHPAPAANVFAAAAGLLVTHRGAAARVRRPRGDGAMRRS